MELADFPPPPVTGDPKKILTIGDPGVGKSALILRLTKDFFCPFYLIWNKDIDEKVYTSTGAPLPMTMVGTKIDRLGPVFDLERVPIDNEQFAQANGFLRCFGPSAKDAINMEEPVRFRADYVDGNYITHEDSELANDAVNITADQDDDSMRRSCWRQCQRNKPIRVHTINILTTLYQTGH
jgi:hypothetical protein